MHKILVWSVATGFVAAAACAKSEKKQEPTPAQPQAGSGLQVEPSGSGVGSAAPSADVPAIEYGWFRGTIDLEGDHSVPFLVNLPKPGSDEKPVIVNGDEEVPIKLTWTKEGVTISPSSDPYPSELKATVKSPKELTGTWHRNNPMWGDIDKPFTLEHLGKKDPTLRFPATTPPANPLPDFAGTWKLQLEIRGRAIGELKQSPDGVVTGYIRPERFGDGQNLAGTIRGDTMYLSTFDGRSAATNIIAKVGANGKLEGVMTLADKFTEKITGVRDAKFRLNHSVALKPGIKKFPLGKLDAPPYKGKPTVVILFATWCPVCHELNMAMQDIYKQYHADGLEVLGVAIDLSEDQKENQLRLDMYRQAHNIPWETHPQPGTPQTFLQIPPINALKNFEALPVTVFLTPDRTVKAMFAGFDGIATGKEKHQAALDELRRHAAALVGAKKI